MFVWKFSDVVFEKFCCLLESRWDDFFLAVDECVVCLFVCKCVDGVEAFGDGAGEFVSFRWGEGLVG